MLIAFTADWHYPQARPEAIAGLGQRLARMNPAAVIVAGDAVDDAAVEHLPRALELLREHYRGPVGFVSGNHELYARPGESSDVLFEEVLPACVRAAGCTWLEDDTLDLPGGVRVLGSVAWYDYGERAPETASWPASRLARAKAGYSTDAKFLRWPWSDVAFAGLLRSRMARRLAESERDPAVRTVVLATHMPIFREQTTRTLEGDPVTRSYFYHLALGAVAARCTKLQFVASGHTHAAVAPTTVARPGLPPLHTAVVGASSVRPPILGWTVAAPASVGTPV